MATAQPFHGSTFSPIVSKCMATEYNKFLLKRHKLFYTAGAGTRCQPAEIGTLQYKQRGGDNAPIIANTHHEELLQSEPGLTSWHTGITSCSELCCVPGEGLASWPVNCPEGVPIRPQIRFFSPEPAARGEEAQPDLWCEVPAVGDLGVLLQKRSHLGVQRRARAPMAAALPAQRGASPPASPDLAKGVLPAQEEQPLPAPEGHASPRTPTFPRRTRSTAYLKQAMRHKA